MNDNAYMLPGSHKRMLAYLRARPDFLQSVLADEEAQDAANQMQSAATDYPGVWGLPYNAPGQWPSPNLFPIPGPAWKGALSSAAPAREASGEDPVELYAQVNVYREAATALRQRIGTLIRINCVIEDMSAGRQGGD